ncbi:2-amino-4-hydroxy-6-hydroxymethyldihydropteridine diphosphokinase [Bacillus fonticola]|uniref:2-amino-4-hydroxy-6- hydroxymethyldihydropteridine diphosphokinase n=1 Tax=Bacillus fonticola TaxID=2728853 RepID=UPI001472D63F|nr:2-amino-4-hydroxy-6-hydroxymethyldihydropteridine diphosphokinase [Bacillus fonticola]
MNRAYLSLGSNMGDRSRFLQDAVEALTKDKAINVVQVSSLYETDPVGFEDQAPFLNSVVAIDTTFHPQELLRCIQTIEQTLGRTRLFRWGPRTIDLDILLFNQENYKSETLTIPHPRLHERAFVLVPLLEIAPSAQLPGMDKPLSEILENQSVAKGVRPWKQRNGDVKSAPIES